MCTSGLSLTNYMSISFAVSKYTCYVMLVQFFRRGGQLRSPTMEYIHFINSTTAQFSITICPTFQYKLSDQNIISLHP